MSTEATTPTNGAAGHAEPAPPPEAAAVEAPAPEAPKEPEKPSSADWAKVRAAEDRARREREEAKQLATKAEKDRAEIESLRAQIESERSKLSLEAFGGDPAAFLEHHKISYDELTRRMLDRPARRGQPQTNPEIEELKAKLSALEQAREAEAKGREEQAREHAWGRVVAALEDEITPPKEGDHAYELLHHEYQSDPEFIQSTLKEMAQLQPELTVAQAAARLEEYLLKQTVSRLGLRKVRAQLSAPAEPKPSTSPAQQAKNGQQASADGPRTLSNRDSSERATEVAPLKPLHEMTLKERRDWERESEARAAEAWASRHGDRTA